MSEQHGFVGRGVHPSYPADNSVKPSEQESQKSVIHENRKRNGIYQPSKLAKDKSRASYRAKGRTKTNLVSKFLWLGLTVLIPIYLPYLVVQVVTSTPVDQPNSNQTDLAPSTSVMDLYHQQDHSARIDLVQVEKNITHLLEDKFGASYQNKYNLMNIGSLRAGATIQQLDCDLRKSGFFWSLNSLWSSKSGQTNECREVESLIDEKSTEAWSSHGKTGKLYLEFRERAKIYAIGIELYKWDSKKLIRGEWRINAKGVNPVSGKNLQHHKIVVELFDKLIEEYSVIEESEDKIRYYFECSTDECSGTYRGLVLEFSTVNDGTSSANLQKIFVFEKFSA